MYPLLAILGKAFICHTERRKVKRKDRRLIIIAVLADGGRGEGGSRGCMYEYSSYQRLLLLKDMCSDFIGTVISAHG
jgi:hypothetical protein